MANNIDEIIAKMTNKFDNITKLVLNNQSEVKESLTIAKNYVCNEIKILYVKLNKIETEVSVLCDRMDQLERDKLNNDVVISGVPVIQNMNLYKVVLDICQAIAIQDGANIVREVFRGSPKDSHLPPIVIKFINFHAKIRFFKNYMKLGNLNLSHIGLQSKSRIYCNDGLTRNNSNIFKMAKSLQKQKIVSRVTTKKGQIFVLPPNTTTYLLIKSIEQLNKLSSANQFDTVNNIPVNSNNVDIHAPGTSSVDVTNDRTTEINNNPGLHKSTVNNCDNSNTSSSKVNSSDFRIVQNSIQFSSSQNNNNIEDTEQPSSLPSPTLMSSQIDSCINDLIGYCNSPASLSTTTDVRKLRSKSYRTVNP